MAGMSRSAPRPEKTLSDATLSLIALAFSELQGDVRHLLTSKWDEPVRRRAEELSSTLLLACLKQGLDELVPLLRSISNLTRLSRSSALPVLRALREKLDSLMRETQTCLTRRTYRFKG